MAIFRRDDQPEDPTQPVSPPSQPPPKSRQQAVTLVAAGSIVEGKIRGNSEVLVEGVLEGEVDLGSTLVIGQGGKIIGDVVARSVRISGQLLGNVQALDKVELMPTGSIEGDVVSPRVAIAEGGFCKGNIEMGAKSREESSANAKPSGDGSTAAPESRETGQQSSRKKSQSSSSGAPSSGSKSPSSGGGGASPKGAK